MCLDFGALDHGLLAKSNSTNWCQTLGVERTTSKIFLLIKQKSRPKISNCGLGWDDAKEKRTTATYEDQLTLPLKKEPLIIKTMVIHRPPN